MLGLAVCLLGSVFLAGQPIRTFAGPAADRLDRFRELARTRLTAAETDGESARALFREMYALLDGEIVESLESGGVFASEGFLQDRLDAFNEAWGGAALRIVRLGRLIVGTFRLAAAAEGSSVRVYGASRGAASLLGTIHREGTPTLYPMPPAAGGAAQFVIVWEAARSGRGTTPVRVELVRHERDRVRTVWSTADLFGGDLQAWSHAVRGPAITLRYELQYAGWVPGCDGQTEQEDLFRYTPARQTFELVRRRLHNDWHRDFRAVVGRLLTALQAADRRALEDLVPDARVRAALSPSLEAEAACDALDTTPPSVVSVAAALGGERRPWALTFRRAGAAWRLVAAEPVIE